MDPRGIIEPDELAGILQENPGGVRLVDATYGAGAAGRIGNAVFFDIDAIADQSHPLPHMLPSPEKFAADVSALGISTDDPVVVYDSSGVYMAAARAWWMFRVFGHDNVRVLNGGLPWWKAQGFPVETRSPYPPAPGRFTSRFRPELVSTMDDILTGTREATTLVLDARAPARFAGTMPEPRPGLRSGHIPGSVNVPFGMLIDPQTGRLREPSALAQIFSGMPGDKKLVASCGSGVTACVIALSFYRISKEDVAVYDGSWSEWGDANSRTPVSRLSEK